MDDIIRGVALILENDESEILILQEFQSKPHFGKYAGMFSIPMETSEPGEPDISALDRLVSEELVVMDPRHLDIQERYVGRYQIVKNVWVSLYVKRATGVITLPQSKNGGEVGNHRWITPQKAYALWLRRGAFEMLSDYISGRSGVTCEYCAPSPS